MKIVVKGKNFEVTDALDQYVEKKLKKIEKYFKGSPITADVTMRIERGMHIVDITVEVDGLLLRGEEETGDMYASIDSVIDKIERQIRKHKTRINRKLRQQGAAALQEAMLGHEETEFEPMVVKTKRFAMKPMSLEEAIMQMDLLGHSFFVYVSDQTEEVNVVYKRKDGNYGLIEPVR
jgi:putative sigma-54 modulation protein